LKILVTGSSGFIGSKLVLSLSEKGHDVTCIIHNKEVTSSSLKKIIGDITDPNLSIPDEKYDIVYHLAAVTPLEKNKKL
jgi:nucleoside-diphosphate-sugar epimerase